MTDTIVAQHNGTIAVTSTPGAGTEFVVSLPVVVEQVREPA
jgi:signal transduction histidine kinase